MNVLKEYKNSTKFVCSKCNNAQLARHGSRYVRTELCSRCLSKKIKRESLPVWG